MRLFILSAALIATSLVHAKAADNPLTREHWHTRPLVVVAARSDDPAVISLQKALEQPGTKAAFADRQVVVFTVLAGQGEREGQPMTHAASQALLAALGLREDGPTTMLLLGKDGGIKLRRSEVSVPIILATIDQMPMRRQEVRRQ